MKKILAVILALLLLPCLYGCNKDGKTDIVTFYYPRINYLYDDESGVIGNEIFDLQGRTYSTEKLIQQYLKGPKNEQLHSPLASRCRLIEFIKGNDYIHLVFADSIDQLMPADLISSLAALAITCFDIADVQEIHISAVTALLDGQQKIIFTKDSIILWDEFTEMDSVTQPTETGE